MNETILERINNVLSQELLFVEAKSKFIDDIVAKGFTTESAKMILKVYLHNGWIKIDKLGGFKIKDESLLNKEVLKDALKKGKFLLSRKKKVMP